jgi:hypothetical protein
MSMLDKERQQQQGQTPGQTNKEQRNQDQRNQQQRSHEEEEE